MKFSLPQQLKVWVRRLPLTPRQGRRSRRRLLRIMTTTFEGCSKGCSTRRTDDTDLPWDTNDAYGGWGGGGLPEVRTDDEQIPIVFVHGNTRDACDWLSHREYFQTRGVSKENLWAITFREPTPSHDSMADQLDDFVENVLYHTDANQVSIVAHSLGVTGARYWMDTYDRYDSVNTFVGIAGANHGLELCTYARRLGLSNGRFKVCDFLRRDYESRRNHPLKQLNHGTETPGDVTYYTIRGAQDALFADCTDSPILEGAEENVELTTDHDGVRESETAMNLIYQWVIDDADAT